MSERTVTVNDRTYAWPSAPVVVVCIDGSEPGYEGSDGGGYIDRALSAGAMPYLAQALETGTFRTGNCVVPTFTNPNNLSIVTGRPPAIHGICGNYFYDPAGDVEVMMNDPALLRSDTIFKAFQDAGARIETSLRRLAGEAGLSMIEAHRALTQLLERKAVKLLDDTLVVPDLETLAAALD